MGQSKSKSSEPKAPTAKQTADVGVPNPEDFRGKADDVVNANDPEGEAYRDQITAKSAQDEAKAKAKRVESDASPDAQDTPSGAALSAVAGISDDAKRGEAYARAHDAVRRGTVAPEDADEVA